MLGLTLMTSACAGLAHPRTVQPGNCGRAWSCTVATTELSLEQRRELASTIEARVADHTLIGVAYDGYTLRLLPECVIEGRYVWRDRDGAIEQRLDSDSAAFMFEDPGGFEGYVRVAEPRVANFRPTRRVMLRARVPRKPRDPGCEEVTHVVEGMIVGVALEAGKDPGELPIALMLDELPVEVQPPTRPVLEDDMVARLVAEIFVAAIALALQEAINAGH